MNNMLKYTKMLLLFVLVLGLTGHHVIVRKKRNIICPVNGIHLKK